LQVQKNFLKSISNRPLSIYQKLSNSLNSRLVISHLAVSLVSIVLMAVFTGRNIFQSANFELEHNLQDLAFTAANAIELPIQEVLEGRVQPEFIRELLARLFADSEQIHFTVFYVDGRPMIGSESELPLRADLTNAPEVIEALASETGRGVDIRENKQGESDMYMAVLVQKEIEVIGILRLAVSTEPSHQAAIRSLLALILFALVIAFGVSLVGWYLAKNLAYPIRHLTNAASKMEHGDLGIRVNPSGPDELRRLAEAFNSMANRLQSNVNELRAFVANASHELRTPLTVAKLHTEALRDGALEDHEVADRFLAEIDSEIDRLIRMVNDLLDLSRTEARLEPGRQAPVDLGAIAHEAYETFKIRASRAEVDLKLDVEPNLPFVMGHEDQLIRVFYNLLENAIKYTPSGGQVELLLRPGPSPQTVRLLVRDTGPGIAPEHISHVFERFYRAETNSPRPNATRGSGLGLSIAKSIVENHGGEIGVSSQVGNGTTFWVDFPAA
jgi:signal transduction histidine kinase